MVDDKRNDAGSRHPTAAEQIAKTAIEFERQRTGRDPKSVTVVLSDETLVITFSGALSPAEQALASSAAGAAQLQDLHQQLFANDYNALRNEIKRITGVEVREAAVTIDPGTGSVVKVFATGSVVQVFLLAGGVATDYWSSGRSQGRPAEGRD